MGQSRRIVTRRQVLRGVGGFTLALPFLPSLATRRAYGQDPTLARSPRFFALTTGHGGVVEDAMFPDESLLTESQQLYAGHQISQGTLAAAQNGDRTELCTVLSASANLFTPELVSKMNVLRGLDIPFYIAHHTGGYLGNFARNDGNGDQGMGLDPMPTIDQLMAWSDSFYPDTSSITLRSIITGSRGRMSYSWSNPGERTGDIEEVRRSDDARALFSEVFIPEEQEDTQEEAAARPPIVDRVLENYRSLRESNRRISSADRQRLDDHMDRLAELQRRINVTPVVAASCDQVREPDYGDGYDARMQAYVDVIAAAFLCGTSRIAVMGIDEANYASDSSDWHQGVAHQHWEPGPQALLQEANQGVFENLLVRLAAQLDVEEADGQTVLDNSLLMWSQECGESTHNARSIPVITFGGAAGQMRTGIYADYRNQTQAGMLSYWSDELGYTGLLYNQWLATALQMMGLPRDEWQGVPSNASTGYGYPQFAEEYTAAQVPEVIDNASELLPLISV